jgi:signal transduction histidine kinase
MAQRLGGLEGNDDITIYLGWTPQFQFAGYYAAKEKGFYQDLGLNVTLNNEKSYVDLAAIANSEGFYGVGTAGMLLTSDQFDGLAVIAAFFQLSPVTLITLKSSNINTLHDLEGKDIIAGTELKAMLLSAGVDLESINIHGYTTDFENLINGKYDAVTYFITDHASKLPGKDSLKFTTFRPIEYGVNFYGESLFTSRREIENNPERVEKVLQATIKGWKYAIQNQEEVVDIIYENYYAGLTRDELSDEAEITIHSLIQPFFYDIGDMQFSKWQRMAELLFTLGLIAEPLNLQGFIYSRESEAEARVQRIIKISALGVAVAAVISLILLLYNRQLKKAVATRTASLVKTNRELDSFVYSVSHDIRSPLSSMQGIINLMRLDPGGMDKYIQLLETSVDRLDTFTGDILDYSRNSRSDLSFKEVDVALVVEKAIADLKFLDEKNDVTFIKEFKLDKVFHTDEWRLEVILGNLISNAIKYSDSDKDTSFVRIRATTDKKGLGLFIEDNGIGIAEKHMDKLYDMFYRATENSRGSGLGLYIVNETIGLLKGKIEIKSVQGEGTQIDIFLPDLTNNKNKIL